MNYKDIKDQVERNQPYLFYENQVGEMFLIDAPVIESQFIRKLIAKEINDVSRAYWGDNLQIDWMISTIKKLKPYFEKHRKCTI